MRYIIAVMAWIGREIIAPPIEALVGGASDGLRRLMRFLAPWLLLGGVIYGLVFVLGKDQAGDFIASILVLVVMALILREMFRALLGGEKKSR